jgi:hypothetical protein
MMVRGLIERDSGAGSFVPTDHGRAALEALLSRPLAVSVAGKSGREGGHGNIDASDPERTSHDCRSRHSMRVSNWACIRIRRDRLRYEQGNRPRLTGWSVAERI